MTAAFTLQAQQLSGTQEYVNRSEYGGSRYSIINWSVNYRIFEEDNSFYIELSNPKVTPSTSSQYGIPGNFYSKLDLGISTWPNSDPTAYVFSLNFTIKYPDGSSHEHNAEINRKNFMDVKNKFKNTNATASSFRVTSVEKMMYNGGNDQKLNDLIAAKKNNHSNNALGNKTTTEAPTNTTNNTTTKPLDNYDANTGLHTNPMTNNNPQPTYNNDKTVEAIEQISNTLSPLLDEWAKNAQKRREVEQEQQRIYEARNEKITANNEQYYQTNFLNKYLSAAKNGDEKARMILVCEILSNAFYKKTMLPDLKNWTITAASNNNFDALNYIGHIAKILGKTQPDPTFGFTLNEGLKMLEEAAKLGSVDAMIQLGNYYDNKSSTYGGKDAEKAFYWFSKAAENGSPNGMYYMGMIYRYRQTIDKNYVVKYKVPKNDPVAFKWFVKSLSNINYAESLFHKSNNSIRGFGGSCFEIDSYKELSLMYEKGIGCEKNIEIANKLNEEYKTSRKSNNSPWGEK